MRQDIRIENHGSLFLIRPLTDRGRRWIMENVQSEGWQWLGGALAVEWRCAEALVEGMMDDGLRLD